MTDDNNTVDIDQDDFENQFFGRTSSTEASETDEPQDEVEEIEEVVENEDNPLATDDDDDDTDTDADEENDDEDDDEEDLEEVPQLKQKKQTRAQKRIEKLVAEARQAERERDALRAELERMRTENTKEVKDKEEAPALRDQLPAEAPNPDAVDKDGKAIYELGEFDPKYIRDLTKFTIEQETKAAKEAAEAEAQQNMIKEAQDELRNRWIDNVDKAEAELPDLREKIAELGETFQNINPEYGEYLASTIMGSDVGPQIMYYLSQNIGEAQKIVASGPVAATLALGRLEAKLQSSSRQEEKRNTKQVSKAPEPPANTERARGHGGRFTVAPDTDDLNAFEREFFNRG